MKVYNKKSDLKLNDDLRKWLQDIRDTKGFEAKEYIERKAKLLNEYMRKCNLKACVVAVSGGIDSAIVLGLVNKASKMDNSPIRKVVPVSLPLMKSTGVTNQREATGRGEELCSRIDLDCNVIDLTEINNLIREKVENVIGITGDDWAIGQLGPYSRTPILYYITSLLTQDGLGAIICGTTNRDEGTYLGYIGKASDGMVDLQIISDLHKSEVYKVARELNVPDSILNVTPSGDMYDNRTDEMVFGASYDFVELYLNYLNMSKENRDLKVSELSDSSKEQFKFYGDNLENLHRYNSHKYLSKSPAVHLDLWNSSTPGGWDNYYEVARRFMEK